MPQLLAWLPENTGCRTERVRCTAIHTAGLRRWPGHSELQRVPSIPKLVRWLPAPTLCKCSGCAKLLLSSWTWLLPGKAGTQSFPGRRFTSVAVCCRRVKRVLCGATGEGPGACASFALASAMCLLPLLTLPCVLSL